MKTKLKSNKGITLIALVVTIIVLIILAGVSITALKGDKGIISKAKDAETETRGASVAEARDLWEVHNEEVVVPKSLNTLLDELIADKLLTKEEKQEILNSTPHQIKIGSRTIIFKEPSTNGGGGTPTPPSVVVTPGEIVTGENKQYTKNGTAVIPKGFAIVPGLDDVSQGLVISDVANDTNNQGNQFVWVPVTDMNEFKRREGYSNGSLQTRLSNCGEIDGTGVNRKITGEKTGVLESETTKKEAIDMYNSIETNKGFYIGRYETSKGINEEATVKKDKAVWNAIPWSSKADTTVDTGGAVEKARAMYGNTKREYGVVSTLCYGVQWDATLKFIDPDYTRYAKDSTGMGNYSNKLINTGSNVDYSLKNIYDMAGNAYEWTMETYDNKYRVNRGAYYAYNGLEGPSSLRSDYYVQTSIYDHQGFRVTLYV